MAHFKSAAITTTYFEVKYSTCVCSHVRITLWINAVDFSHIFSIVRFISHCIQHCNWPLCFKMLCICCEIYVCVWFDIMAHMSVPCHEEPPATKGHFPSERALAGRGRVLSQPGNQGNVYREFEKNQGICLVHERTVLCNTNNILWGFQVIAFTDCTPIRLPRKNVLTWSSYG